MTEIFDLKREKGMTRITRCEDGGKYILGRYAKDKTDKKSIGSIEYTGDSKMDDCKSKLTAF